MATKSSARLLRPLLKTPWILDIDTTVKPLYGHQEAATNGKADKLAMAYHRLSDIFNALKTIAPQLTLTECWSHLLQKIIDYFGKKIVLPDHSNVLIPTG